MRRQGMIRCRHGSVVRKRVACGLAAPPHRCARLCARVRLRVPVRACVSRHTAHCAYLPRLTRLAVVGAPLQASRLTRLAVVGAPLQASGRRTKLPYSTPSMTIYSKKEYCV